MDNFIVIAALAVVALVVFVLAKTAVVVPQQAAYVIENLGKYSSVEWIVKINNGNI